MTDWDVLVQFTLYCDLSISSGSPIIKFTVLVLVSVTAAGSPPAGEDDGVGGFCKNDELSPGMAGQLYSRAAEQDGCAAQHALRLLFPPAGQCRVFFCRHSRRSCFVISAEGGSYRQGWRANCIQGRRSRMDAPNTPSEAGIQPNYVVQRSRTLPRRSRERIVANAAELITTFPACQRG